MHGPCFDGKTIRPLSLFTLYLILLHCRRDCLKVSLVLSLLYVNVAGPSVCQCAQPAMHICLSCQALQRWHHQQPLQTEQHGRPIRSQLHVALLTDDDLSRCLPKTVLP